MPDSELVKSAYKYDMTNLTYPERSRIEQEWIAMADSVNADVCLTLTLCQARSYEGSGGKAWERGDRYVYERVYDQFIKRLSREIYGESCYKRTKKRLPNFGALEGDGRTKHFHFHVGLRKPDHMTFEDFADACGKTWLRSPWAKEDVDIQPITGGWAKYCSKEGSDAFLIT